MSLSRNVSEAGHVLDAVAQHHSLSRDALLQRLFG